MSRKARESQQVEEDFIEVTEEATMRKERALAKIIVEEMRIISGEQGKIIGEQAKMIRELTGKVETQNNALEAQSKALADLQAQVNLLSQEVALRVPSMQQSQQPSISYAAIARTPPDSRPSLGSQLTASTTPSSMLDKVYCTIDTSRVGQEDKDKISTTAIRKEVEKHMQPTDNGAKWACVAVTKDPRNQDRVRVVCRNETELEKVKQAAQEITRTGARVMKDQMFPVKVDSVARTAILDQDGSIKDGIIEALSEENEVKIAKISWLSNKNNGKAYGSMVIYMTKSADARKLLEKEWFDFNGESGYTRIFEPKATPTQCYNCQQVGHKAFSCNRPQLRSYAGLAITEPYALRTDVDTIITAPMGHTSWTKILPSSQAEGRWPYRSMLWVQKELQFRQVVVDSPDIVAILLELEKPTIIVAAYVPGPSSDTEILNRAMQTIEKAIKETRAQDGRNLEVMVMGDFNRHDRLWGGEDVSESRQGEADRIVESMLDLSLTSLLPVGRKTWSNRDQESTIDLILASEGLQERMIRCDIHETEHGSDHRAIESAFLLGAEKLELPARPLLKNAPWEKIREVIKADLSRAPNGGSVQGQTDLIMEVVGRAVLTLTPKAKPSPYAKRWWTADLTQLRQYYTYWRNLAATQRRMGRPQASLESSRRGAAREYHRAIRKQRKAHWEDFLSNDVNIWQAAKYLDPSKGASFDKVPALKKVDGTIAVTNSEIAEDLISTFFPALPDNIEEDPTPQSRQELQCTDLTMEEVKAAVFKMSPWKAPGEDGLPAVVWIKVWPVVADRVLALFQASLREGQIPHQWRNAKIIPLKKPGKGDYTKAKAWRPISLLSTLGKAMEAVIAERVSYWTETENLLPGNQFGARKRRSTEQALMLLQEKIYQAWRSRKVVSLVSFDVKGAYNGVCSDRLLQRMAARRIPAEVVRWVGAFCANRTATIQVNGYTTPPAHLPQAGLPQGSPLSPILFLFFNADLVSRKIDGKGGAMAFVDDYTAWVVGDSPVANTTKIKEIVEAALQWEKRSGATFEEDKTDLIHFTRTKEKAIETSINIKGQVVTSKGVVKVLGVLMDTELRYKAQIAKAAIKGTKAAMALRRMRSLSPRTARQLFTATVAPTMDYASPVWQASNGIATNRALNRAQKIGAQAITGAFNTVALAIAEAEAHIQPIRERHRRRAINLWTDIQTLPKSNPLTRLLVKPCRRFNSPLQKVAGPWNDRIEIGMETIEAFTVAPWIPRMKVTIDQDVVRRVYGMMGVEVILASAASIQQNQVIYGSAARIITRPGQEVNMATAMVFGQERHTNPCVAELAAMATTLENVSPNLRNARVSLVSRNQAALKSVAQPAQHSGQIYLKRIYASMAQMQFRNIKIEGWWAPANSEDETLKAAKVVTRRSPGRLPTPNNEQLISKATAKRSNHTASKEAIRENVGKFTTKIDSELPGRHTKPIYDSLNKKEAKVLVQLRTGMAKLNQYLFRIGAKDAATCTCGMASETVNHFLFVCTKWKHLRGELKELAANRYGDLSFYLGGRSAQRIEGKELDPPPWKPNLKVIKATIRFADRTGRLKEEAQSDIDQRDMVIPIVTHPPTPS